MRNQKNLSDHLIEYEASLVKRTAFKDLFVLASLDSFVKDGIYGERILIAAVLSELREDPIEKSPEESRLYLIGMLRNNMALDEEGIYLSAYPEESQHYRSALNSIKGNVIKLSRDKDYIELSPLEQIAVDSR